MHVLHLLHSTTTIFKAWLKSKHIHIHNTHNIYMYAFMYMWWQETSLHCMPFKNPLENKHQ